MKPDIIETICFSFIVHLGLLYYFGRAPELIQPPQIQVNIIEKASDGQKPLKPSSPGNYAKSLEREKQSSKSNINDLGTKENEPDNEPIDLSEYANQVKLKIDPIWLRKIRAYTPKHIRKFNLEVLIKIDKNGKILSTKMIKSSGYMDVDLLVFETFREAKSLPKPPKSKAILEQGIIWEFTF